MVSLVLRLGLAVNTLFGKNKFKFGQTFFASPKICTPVHLWYNVWRSRCWDCIKRTNNITAQNDHVYVQRIFNSSVEKLNFKQNLKQRTETILCHFKV